MSGESFVKSDQPDFDAWLSGARLPERSCTVFGRADLLAEMEALEEGLRAGRAAPVILDDRLVSVAAIDASAETARRIEGLREQMAESAMLFRFRALSKAEQLPIRDAAKAGGDTDPDLMASGWVAASCVSHTLTVAQVDSIRGKIGEGQFAKLWDTAWAASNDKAVTVPFWPGVSAAATRLGS